MQKFELTAPNAFVRRATIVDNPVLVEARLQELHPDLKAILFKDAIRGGLGGAQRGHPRVGSDGGWRAAVA